MFNLFPPTNGKMLMKNVMCRIFYAKQGHSMVTISFCKWWFLMAIWYSHFVIICPLVSHTIQWIVPILHRPANAGWRGDCTHSTQLSWGHLHMVALQSAAKNKLDNIFQQWVQLHMSDGGLKCVPVLFMRDDSSEGPKCFVGLCDQSHWCYKPECTLWLRFWTWSYHIW